MMTRTIIQEQYRGYRSYALGIPRERNWHRQWPQTLEYQAWFEGWDQAEKDSE